MIGDVGRQAVARRIRNCGKIEGDGNKGATNQRTNPQIYFHSPATGGGTLTIMWMYFLSGCEKILEILAPGSNKSANSERSSPVDPIRCGRVLRGIGKIGLESFG